MGGGWRGHEHTTLVVDYYNREGQVAERWEDGFSFSRQVMVEDVELCERQYAGLASGVFSQGRLGPGEHGVHRFQTLVQERLDAQARMITEQSNLEAWLIVLHCALGNLTRVGT